MTLVLIEKQTLVESKLQLITCCNQVMQPEEVKRLQDKITSLKQDLECHRQEA